MVPNIYMTLYGQQDGKKKKIWREGNLGDEPGFAKLRPDAETMLELILAWIFFL
jgi:hypothetical protein